MRPGVNVAIRKTPPVRSIPTDAGVWFVAGLADKGSTTDPILVQSMDDFERLLGLRQSYSAIYDALEVFFREGGNTAYVSRVVGPAAAAAFVVLNDAGAAATLRVEANSPGEWGNKLNIQVVAGGGAGTFVLVVSHDDDGELERSPDLADDVAALAWATGSQYIKLIDQASANDPAVVAATSLAGGLDDRANAGDAQWAAAVDRFTKGLGPGQVSMPGRTTATAHLKLTAHAKANNRVAILDPPDTVTVATLTGAVVSARNVDAKWGAMFGPWIKIPGLTSGTTRTVSPSGLIAGRIAAQDAAGSPNVPAAGARGTSRYAVGLSQIAWSDADRETLNKGGFNVIRMHYGIATIYGWRSLVDPVVDKLWVDFGNSRLIMEIAAKADEIGEQFMFEELDGQRRTINRWGGALTGMLMEYWNDGSLYGTTPDQAFVVDVGPTVNTEVRIADGELRAVLGIRPSPFAEMITIEIVKTPITEEVV